MATTLSTNCYNWWYCVRTAKATFPYWKRLFLSYIFKQLLLKNCTVDFVEICNVCTRKVIIKAAKRIFNSDNICCSHCDFYFGVTFLEHTVYGNGTRIDPPQRRTAPDVVRQSSLSTQHRASVKLFELGVRTPGGLYYRVAQKWHSFLVRLNFIKY